MSELNYPFVNVPPIVYNQHLAKTNVIPDTIEAYDNTPINAYTPHANQSSITFLPMDKGMVAFQGEVFHPKSHILTPTNETFKVRRKSIVSSRGAGGGSGCNPDKEDCDKKAVIPAKSTTLYVAALGSLGLIILYSFMSKTQY